MIYYSEYGEDHWIDTHLQLPQRGIYLDVGASHPEHCNNTAFLRDRGWLGLAIDGVKEYAPHWVGRQTFIHAILAARDKVWFKHVKDNSYISRVAEKDPDAKHKKAVTLQSILNETFASASPQITKIDFVSLDIEGMEFEVFQTFNWQEYDPKIIVAEYNTGGIGEDFRLRDLLVQSGRYKVVHQTVANLIYSRV